MPRPNAGTVRSTTRGTCFEELPELKASEILKPELLKGPHYVVRDPVPTGSGMNQFTIDSDFGVFEADGLGNARDDRRGSARSRSAQVIITGDQRP